MDPRDAEQAFEKELTEFDEQSMTASLYGQIRLPVVYKVCGLCNGKGKHVNPSIDSGGISAADFADDPCFREEYFSGVYDVTCYRCAGKRVQIEVNWMMVSEEDRNRAEIISSEEDEFRREVEAERRFGA